MNEPVSVELAETGVLSRQILLPFSNIDKLLR